MDDIRLWLWIIILVVYYIARARNKWKKEAEERRAKQSIPQQGDGQSPARPLTFEDLLREIQAGRPEEKKEVEPAWPPVTSTKPEPDPWEIDYEDDPVEEIPDLKTTPPSRESRLQTFETYEAYERAKAEAFNHPSLEETMTLEDTDVKFSHFRNYEVQTGRNVLNEYVNELKDPEGFRKAFIMSEILKPKF